MITLQRGFDITRAQQRPGAVPVVSSGGIASFHDTAAVKGPGVIIGRKGTLGTVFYVAEDYWPHDTTLWVKDFKGNDPRFVYYFMKGLSVAGLNVGSANPTLNRNHVHPLPISWPDRNQQERIVGTLAALDDKIAVNERIVEGCDDLRSLHLREFLLLRSDSIAGRPLSALADFVNGRAFTKGATGAGRMVVRIAELNSGPGGSTVYNDIEVMDRHLAGPGDILFSWSGTLTVARWFREEAIINQHIFKVIPRDGVPSWLAFELVAAKLESFRRIAAGKATTMGHIQRHHLDELVSVPNKSAIAQLDAVLRPPWERALAAERESLVLARLRDALLPGLMSGEIRVRDAERAVEEAT